jgi:hypothetical protein
MTQMFNVHLEKLCYSKKNIVPHSFVYALLTEILCFQGISEEVFGTLAIMLPSIFRVSNPLVFKASSSTPHTPKSG